MLIILTVWLFGTAVQRVISWSEGGMEEVDGKIMTIIASIGIVVNIILAYILGEHHMHYGESCDGGHDHSHGHSHGHSHNHNDGEKEKRNNGNEKALLKGHQRSGSGSASDCGGGHAHDHAGGHSHDHASHAPATTTASSSSLLEEGGEASTSLYGSTNAATSSQDDEHKEEEESLIKPVFAAAAATPEKRNVNMEAAYLHVLGDLLQSIAVLIAGIIIWYEPRWQIADPLCTILFSFIVAYSTVGIVSKTINVLLEGVPEGIDWDEVNNAIKAVPGVSNVHDLHIWSINVGKPALTVHCSAVDTRQALIAIVAICKRNKIEHSTVQIQESRHASSRFLPNGVAEEDCLVCDENANTNCR
jgi:zinc transporter 2